MGNPTENNGSDAAQVFVAKENLDAALKVMHQENLELRRQLAQMAEQIQRVQRVSRVDEREFNVGLQQSNRATIRAVEELARSVDGLVQQKVDRETQVDLEGQQLYWANKQWAHRQVKQRINHLRYLLAQTLEKTYLCPCEKHMGIRIVRRYAHPVVNEQGERVEELVEDVLVENECPFEVWKWMSRVAFDDGTLVKFNKEVPLSDFLKDYALT